MSRGKLGTGGGASAPPRETGRPGDGLLRKVLSVIDPLLPCLSSPAVGLPLVLGDWERDAFDARLCMRLVWTSPT